MFDVSKITEEAKPIVQQVARIYYQHTQNFFIGLMVHGSALKERNRLVRLLSTQVSPIIYHVLTIEKENAIEAWQLPKNEAIKLLPTKEMRSYAEQFYESAKRFYPEKKSIEDALGMVQNGVSFFRSAKHWYQHLNKNAGS
mgnify:FL=1